MNAVLDMMMNAKSFKCYEYYDGLQVTCDGEYTLVPGEDEDLLYFQFEVFKQLPNTNIEEFGYTSRFSSETSYKCLTGIPSSLKVLHLENYDEISPELLNGIQCIHEDEYGNITNFEKWVDEFQSLCGDILSDDSLIAYFEDGFSPQNVRNILIDEGIFE